ncbi:CDP-alcohol phosphatidyltransferase family protein [Aeromicrobium sp.]|uniref:CDP-alcohol phosphatidyltransferase family protein n=1 Tax=Aeromicrobium sp. TaxID=1871063 RepID=UPI003C6A38DC
MHLVTEVRASYDQLAMAQKPGAGVPFYMRAINRPMGRLIAAVAGRLGATPDQMTAMSGLLFVLGMTVLVLFDPSVPVAVTVTVLLQLAFAFDSADGQLARLTGTGSVAGEWLDHVVDSARLLALHIGVAVCLVLHTDVDSAWLLVPLGFAGLASVRFFAQILAEQLGGSATGQTARGRGWLQTPADAGVVNAVFLLWPWTPVFLAVYAALAAANLVLLLATLQRKHRALRNAVPA